MRTDAITWHAHARVDKFTLAQIDACRTALGLDREPTGAELLAFCEPADSIEADGNLLTRLGLARIGNLLIGTASTQALDATHCRIGVGDSNTAAATTDTDLGGAAGATHRQFQLVDSRSVGSGANSGVYTIVATFGTSVGNFHWQEWGLDGGTANGTTVTADTNTTPGLVNHKITDLGTKTSAASWVFTITITLA